MEHATGDLQRLQAMFDKQVQELKDTNKKQAKTAKVSEYEPLDTASQYIPTLTVTPSFSLCRLR